MPTTHTNPRFSIHPCTVADGPALARNNMSAFWTDPVWRLSFPPITTTTTAATTSSSSRSTDDDRDKQASPQEEEQKLQDIIASAAKRLPITALLANREHKRHAKLVLHDYDHDHDGTLAGYARWILPDRLADSSSSSACWPAAQTPAVSGDEEARLRRECEAAEWRVQGNGLGGPLEEIMGRLMGEGEFIELEYLAVHPDFRGQGVATALVAHGIAEADKLDVDMIVMAYEAAVGIYERLGFETVESLVQDVTPYGWEGEFGAYFMVWKCSKNRKNSSKK